MAEEEWEAAEWAAEEDAVWVAAVEWVEAVVWGPVGAEAKVWGQDQVVPACVPSADTRLTTCQETHA